jgi:hypothetical protein
MGVKVLMAAAVAPAVGSPREPLPVLSAEADGCVRLTEIRRRHSPRSAAKDKNCGYFLNSATKS